MDGITDVELSEWTGIKDFVLSTRNAVPMAAMGKYTEGISRAPVLALIKYDT